MKVLIDTSVWISVLRTRSDTDLKEQVTELVLNGVAAWCGMIQLELWNGIGDKKERHQLKKLDDVIITFIEGRETFEMARNIAAESRTHGLTIPSTDILIYACSKKNNLDLLHKDRHFNLLEQIFG
jgi:predicted nucleic acid-binding protein